MAETSEGWDGTVDEAGIARILAAAAPPRLEGFTVTAVPGQRRVICAAGESHYAFIRYATDVAGIFDLATPTQGKWHLLVQRRDWGLNAVSTVLLLGPDTASTSLPAAPPATYPAEFSDAPGITADIPLAWIWVRGTDTTVVVVPIAPASRFEGIEPGLLRISPTAVVGTGASLAADGTVVFTGAGGVSIDLLGLFSSRFRNYRMLSRFTQKNGSNIQIQCLNAAGAPITTPSYFANVQALVNAARQDSYAGAVRMMPNLIALVSGSQAGASIDIFTPFEAQRTTFHGNVFATGGVLTNAETLGALETSDVVSGLRIIFPAGAAATGTLKFYGYA